MKQLGFAVFVLENDRVCSIPLCDPPLRELLYLDTSSPVHEKLKEILPALTSEQEQGILFIRGYRIEYARCGLCGEKSLLLLVLHDSSDVAIYQFALDLLDIGVQIYQRDTSLMSINIASAEMSNVSRDNLLGQKLTEIYDTNETYSTVLQVLNTRSPVYNKVAQFDVRSGGFTTVLNTSIPYFDAGGSLRAVVNLEYNQTSLERMAATTQKLQQIVPPAPLDSNANTRDHYYRFEDIIGQSRNLMEAVEMAKKAVTQDGHLFIVGETGTGKELIAQSIYSAAASRYKAFVAVNCSTIPEELADSTLFGSVKGAFTGSVHSEGLFAAADGGILFLDEIDSLGLSSQARLLRVLQEGTYMKVGSTKEISCSVRVLASTNQRLLDLVRAGKFRADLFYRLSGIVITIPALRDRREDIPLLTHHFLRYYSNKFMKNVSVISEDVARLLYQYDWPGNIRELKNVMEFAVNVAGCSEIHIQDLPMYLQNKSRGTEGPAPLMEQLAADQCSLTERVEFYEKELIGNSLHQNNYNITKTAQALAISRQTLQHKIKKYHLMRL